ncbi:MAG: hypothetical protein QXP34_03205 [Candidatus Aenigmatarchaeota archaeon]
MNKIKSKLLWKVIEIPTRHLEDIDDEEARFFKRFVENSTFTFAWSYAENLPHEYTVMRSKELIDKMRKVFQKHGFKIENLPFKREDLINMKYVVYKGYLYWQMDEVLNRRWIYGYIVDLEKKRFEYVSEKIKKDIYESVIHVKNHIIKKFLNK